MVMLKSRRGFTLIEMIVVIAIITILIAIIAPMYTRLTEKASESVCAGNRGTLSRMITLEMVVGKHASLGEAFASAEGQKLAGDCKCPSGGVITIENDILKCSIHAAPTAGDNVFDKMDGILKDIQDGGIKDSKEIIKKFYELNGNTLPKVSEMEKNLVFAGEELYGNPKDLYWRPSKITMDGKTNFVLFASPKNDPSHASWNGFMCYFNGKYYKSTAESWNHKINSSTVALGSTNYKTTAEVISALEKKGFVPVE